MDDTRRRPQGANDGEGSRSVEERHRKAATEFARRSDTLQKVLETERAVENYRDEFEGAEKPGPSRSAGDLRSDVEGKTIAVAEGSRYSS